MSVVSGALGASAQKSAGKKSAAAQRAATEAQERIFEQQRSDFEPYRRIGLAALPYLASALSGKPYEIAADGYSLLSDEELGQINQNLEKYNPEVQWYRNERGDIVNTPRAQGSYGMPGLEYERVTPDEINALNKSYNPDMQWYRGPNGQIVSADKVPKQQIQYSPGQSPAAKYQLEQGNIALGRALGSRGMAGGGGAAVKLADLSKNVAASDWQDQYNRLLDLVKIGTGASSATGGASATLSNAYGVGAQNLGNIYGQMGANKASLYGGISGGITSGIGTGLQAYQTGRNLGWWGTGGSTAGSAASVGSSSAIDEALAAMQYA